MAGKWVGMCLWGYPGPQGTSSLAMRLIPDPSGMSCLWKACLMWWEGLTAGARRGQAPWGTGWAGPDLVADLGTALAVLYS